MVDKGQTGDRGDKKGTLGLNQMSMMLNHGGKETKRLVMERKETRTEKRMDGLLVK